MKIIMSDYLVDDYKMTSKAPCGATWCRVVLVQKPPTTGFERSFPPMEREKRLPGKIEEWTFSWKIGILLCVKQDYI